MEACDTREYLQYEKWDDGRKMKVFRAEQASFENNGIRRQGKEYVKPFERMLDELDN